MEKKDVFPKDKFYGLVGVVDKESPLIDKEPEDTVFTWPNLVFRELLCMLFVIIFLLVISLLFNAPLEEAAMPNYTPNPVKAPWYFLWLQELLAYFDPWIAAIIIPTITIFGLCSLPYLDKNPKGNGYYTFRERRFVISVFLFGVLMLVILIIIGAIFRGPSWAWYWPWESWEVHKHVVETWSLPNAISIPLIILYIIFMFIMVRKLLPTYDLVRYTIASILLTIMFAVPIKILLRIIFGIKYLITTPWFKI